MSENDFLDVRFDTHQLNFDLPEGVTSYMVIPHTDGQSLVIDELQGPGGTLDMLGSYSFANANAFLLESVLPVLVPQSPDFAGRVASGAHTMTLGSHTNFCHALIPKIGPGTTLDLNLYFVGDVLDSRHGEGTATRFGFQTIRNKAWIFGQRLDTVRALEAKTEIMISWRTIDGILANMDATNIL